MRLRRNIKFDLIIYSSLIGAVIILGFGTKAYFESLDDYKGFKKEVKSALKEMNNTNEEPIVEVASPQPEITYNINEKDLITNYLESILDNIKQDEIVTNDMIRTWGSYEIIETKYLKQITDTYYSYVFKIKINNPAAQLPTSQIDEMSTSEYVCLTLIANLVITPNECYVKGLSFV